MNKELSIQSLDIVCPTVLDDDAIDELAELNKAGESIPAEFIDLLIDRCEGIQC